MTQAPLPKKRRGRPVGSATSAHTPAMKRAAAILDISDTGASKAAAGRKVALSVPEKTLQSDVARHEKRLRAERISYIEDVRQLLGRMYADRHILSLGLGVSVDEIVTRLRGAAAVNLVAARGVNLVTTIDIKKFSKDGTGMWDLCDAKVKAIDEAQRQLTPDELRWIDQIFAGTRI